MLGYVLIKVMFVKFAIMFHTICSDFFYIVCLKFCKICDNFFVVSFISPILAYSLFVLFRSSLVYFSCIRVAPICAYFYKLQLLIKKKKKKKKKSPILAMVLAIWYIEVFPRILPFG
jgi:hypothetical protein